MANKIKKKFARFPKKLNAAHSSITYTVLTLLGFGLIVIYNATSYYSQIFFNNAFRFVLLQSAWVVIGLFFFFALSRIDFTKLEKVAYLAFGANLFLLCILAFVGLFLCRGPEDKGIIFVPCVNGASRWFYLNPAPLPQIPFLGTFGFQPGELIKLTVILYLSFQLNKIRRKKMPESEGFTVYLTTVLVLLGLFFMQPNMSTAILVFLICTSIYWVSDYPLKNMFTFFPVMGVIGLIGVFSSSYRRDRLFTLLQGGEGSDTSLGYHIKQVLIALGTGGFFGVGFGQSRQKYQYLPEVSSDSIFAIIGEEFGFIGTCAVLLVFAFLLYKGLEIAKNAESDLGKMLAVGFTSWIGFQLFINVAAMTKLIPLTGVPIPLISYGGSSIVFSLAGLGILASVQKQSQ